MLIWDIIRDWFVMNVWGGITSNSNFYHGVIGFDTEAGQNADTTTVYFKLNMMNDLTGEEFVHISLGDWLSTISTIIILVVVSVGLFFLVRYFFRMFAGLLSGR